MLPESRSRTLLLYLPRLPETDGSMSPLADAWIEDLFWFNCGVRLVELKPGGQSERDLLESCSISKEDGSYRLQIKKGRRFHSGDEITAADVIASLLRVARRPSSASQLGQLLRYQGAACERSFKLHSRYRFEIFLQGVVPNLLERLALPECSISRAGGISGGPWRLERRDAHGLELRPLPGRQGGEAIYEQIRIETLERAPPLSASSSADAPAFIAIFPGSLLKTPPTTVLSGAMTLALHPELQLLLWLKEKSAEIDPLRAALLAFARQRQPWGLSRLAQLYPEQSFGVEALVHESPWIGSHQGKKWTFSYEPGVVAPAFLEDLAAYAAHHHRVQLSFSTQVEGSDGALFALPDYAREGSLRALELGLQALQRRGVGGPETRALLERLHTDTDVSHRERALRELLHKLVHHPQFLPLGRAPLHAYSNRTLPRDLPLLGGLRLSEIGDSRPRQAAKELREVTVSALGAAVEMLAHDIRRPFATLEGVLNLLASTEDPERLRGLAQQYLPHVRRITHTVNEMISDILEMGTSAETQIEPLSPLTALEESLRLLLPSKKRLEFSCDWQHRLMLAGDVYKITRIFSNILNNAIEATPDGGSIKIASREHEEAGSTWIDISIQNSGSYISPEKRQRIFEAFYTEGKDKGTGLGLAIVKKFVLAHQGHLRCESDTESGTRFIVSLPSSYRPDPRPAENEERIQELWRGLGPSLPSSQQKPKAAAQPKVKLKLLWIDDDPLDLIYGRELLATLAAKDSPYEVDLSTVGSGTEALELAAAQRFDLILIDYQLGSSDGLTFIPQFRKLLPEARIALHSHRSSSAIQQAAKQVGADFFFPKPLQEGSFLSFCQSALPPAAQLILVEDDPLFVEIWQTHSPCALQSFASPERFLEALAADANLLKGCRALISDGLFAAGERDGLSFLREMAARYPELPLYLCTHLPSSGAAQLETRPWKSLSKEPEAIAGFLRSLFHT